MSRRHHRIIIMKLLGSIMRRKRGLRENLMGRLVCDPLKASMVRDLADGIGFRGLFANHFVALCSAFATIGGLLFGYE